MKSKKNNQVDFSTLSGDALQVALQKDLDDYRKKYPNPFDKKSANSNQRLKWLGVIR